MSWTQVCKEEFLPVGEIAHRLKRNGSTMQHFRKLYEYSGCLDRNEGSEKKKIGTDRDYKEIRQSCLRNRFKTGP